MTYVLLIDTAHREARVALVRDGEVLIQRSWENTPRVGTDVLVRLKEMLEEAGLNLDEVTRVAVHAGPGSYSVLRSGIVAGEILAFALGAELAAVSGEDLEALASQAQSAEPVDMIEAVYS